MVGVAEDLAGLVDHLQLLLGVVVVARLPVHQQVHRQHAGEDLRRVLPLRRPRGGPARRAPPRPRGPCRSRPGRSTRRCAGSCAASCSGLSATTIWMVLQLGLAMMPFGRLAADSMFTSGTTSGTSGSIRQALELSMTTAPRAAAAGRQLARGRGAGAEEGDVHALERVGLGELHLDLAAPERQALAHGPRRGQRQDALRREMPRLQGAQHLAPHHARRPDHRNDLAHGLVLSLSDWGRARREDAPASNPPPRHGGWAGLCHRGRGPRLLRRPPQIRRLVDLHAHELATRPAPASSRRRARRPTASCA